MSRDIHLPQSKLRFSLGMLIYGLTGFVPKPHKSDLTLAINVILGYQSA